MKRTRYHVTERNDGTWAGKIEGASRASVVGETKAEVLKETIQMAKNQSLAQVLVHKRKAAGGGIQEERTYGGKDPFPPKG